MATITLDLPEDVMSALRRSPEEFAHEMRVAAAIHWYSQGELSQERAAQMADMTRQGFLELLAEKRIDAFHVDLDELKREIERG